MSYSVEVRNVKAVQSALTAQVAKIELASRNIVAQGGALIERKAKQRFRPRPPGSEVHRNGRLVYLNKGKYAPRKPKPTNRSGNLQSSITSEVRRVGPGRWMSSTGPTVKYGRSVERGKQSSTSDYAVVLEGLGYPYMTPAFEEARPELAAIYREQWRRALQ